MDIQQTVCAAEQAAKSADLPVADLCRRVGVDRATWQRWKSGKTVPTLHNWERIQETLAELSKEDA